MLRYLLRSIKFRPKMNVIAIVGTTGVGKSQFSIDLAKAVDGEIVNADSMQVYKGLDTITNKHPVEEREGVPHHVMDNIDWKENYFIHRFSQDAKAIIDDIHRRGKVPIIIGGTHYYLLNLLFKNKTIGEKEEIQKRELSKDELDILDGPVEGIFNKLSKIDPIIAEKFHPQDRRKLRRALEVYYTTGQKPSGIYHRQKVDELEESSLVYNTLLFWVYSDPEVLKPRLDKRVDTMMQTGAMNEVKDLYSVFESSTPAPDLTSGIWQVIGFKEFLPWLQGGCKDVQYYEEGIERMKIRTRQYAKYQVKWIKKLLAVELQKESRFNFKYGGKLYLLDATDLTQWKDDVKARGIAISKQFLTLGPLSVANDQVPSRLSEVFPSEEYLSGFNSNKRIDSAQNWRHYQCPVCTDKRGSALVAVGLDNWNIHLNSKRHKRQFKRRKIEKEVQNDHGASPTEARKE